MTTPTRLPRRTTAPATWALILTATTGLLTGCTATSTPVATTPPTTTAATATPEPTPTPDAAQIARELEDTNIAAAKATYVDLVALVDQIGKDTMADWERIMPFIGGDLISSMPTYFQDYETAGVRATGDTKVVSQDVVEYIPDPNGSGHERMTLDACVDSSAIEMFTPDGVSVLESDWPERLINTITMQHQDDGRWTLDSGLADADRPC
ncbi:MAG: hypothetical protein HGA44_09015 [Cellulomonadaceae bacterium]|nr:hypothetical protein [Cellulomonadaceae bacterium]